MLFLTLLRDTVEVELLTLKSRSSTASESRADATGIT